MLKIETCLLVTVSFMIFVVIGESAMARAAAVFDVTRVEIVVVFPLLPADAEEVAQSVAHAS